MLTVKLRQLSGLALLLSGIIYQSVVAQTASYQMLMQDVLINADLWGDSPSILSANYAFENIIGVPGNQQDVIAAGGTWETVTSSTDPPYRALTSSATPQQVAFGFGYPVSHADAMPVVFSWPVLPSTVQPSDFRITLNTGAVVTPMVVSISPNIEYNERNTVVVFGEFGNRLTPATEGAIYIERTEIVDDGTPLKLVGASGPVSAVGLSRTSGNPWLPGGGPTLVGAKLSHMLTTGEGAPALFGAAQLPNDGLALYGSDAQFRLRVLTTGGFSADGVVSVLPSDFATFFRIRLMDNGMEQWLTQTGTSYATSAGSITVVGLADLGLGTDPYNDGYIEDHDNQIDIILKGDESAMRLITDVEIPAAGGYSPFYNPGGPGNNPTPGVAYTQPGPYDLQPVIIAIDDPLTVTYIIPEPATSTSVLVAMLVVVTMSGRSHRTNPKIDHCNDSDL